MFDMKLLPALAAVSFFASVLNSTRQHFCRLTFLQIFSRQNCIKGTTQQITNIPEILQNIEESPELKTMWDKYRKQFAYAKDIEYGQIIAVLKTLTE